MIIKRRAVYAICWRCEGDIYSNADCNYIKSRDGNYQFCPTCYDLFLENSKDFLCFEKSRKKELQRSFANAIENFHNERYESANPIIMNDLPSALVHTASWYLECEICLEILRQAKKDMDNIIDDVEKCIKKKDNDDE